jgi:hypothetical protein
MQMLENRRRNALQAAIAEVQATARRVPVGQWIDQVLVLEVAIDVCRVALFCQKKPAYKVGDSGRGRETLAHCDTRWNSMRQLVRCLRVKLSEIKSSLDPGPEARTATAVTLPPALLTTTTIDSQQRC